MKDKIVDDFHLVTLSPCYLVTLSVSRPSSFRSFP